MIRVGVEGARPAILSELHRRQAAVLISANSLWNNARRSWRSSWLAYRGLDIALDSGGFVAMRQYGGFRWTPYEYASLASAMKPSWWAQMDYCCEPEIAVSRSAVLQRIDHTAVSLQHCQDAAHITGASPPMIVLQGWEPQDYVSGPAFDDPAFAWPELVGVGSVCRRSVQGLRAIVAALDRGLPDHVKLHFFGVKGAALKWLRSHPRFASMDSMAWSMAARWDALKHEHSCNADHRAKHLCQWLDRQTLLLNDPQPTFL